MLYYSTIVLDLKQGFTANGKQITGAIKCEIGFDDTGTYGDFRAWLRSAKFLEVIRIYEGYGNKATADGIPGTETLNTTFPLFINMDDIKTIMFQSELVVPV